MGTRNDDNYKEIIKLYIDDDNMVDLSDDDMNALIKLIKSLDSDDFDKNPFAKKGDDDLSDEEFEELYETMDPEDFIKTALGEGVDSVGDYDDEDEDDDEDDYFGNYVISPDDEDDEYVRGESHDDYGDDDDDEDDDDPNVVSDKDKKDTGGKESKDSGKGCVSDKKMKRVPSGKRKRDPAAEMQRNIAATLKDLRF